MIIIIIIVIIIGTTQRNQKYKRKSRKHPSKKWTTQQSITLQQWFLRFFSWFFIFLSWPEFWAVLSSSQKSSILPLPSFPESVVGSGARPRTRHPPPLPGLCPWMFGKDRNQSLRYGGADSPMLSPHQGERKVKFRWSGHRNCRSSHGSWSGSSAVDETLGSSLETMDPQWWTEERKRSRDHGVKWKKRRRGWKFCLWPHPPHASPCGVGVMDWVYHPFFSFFIPFRWWTSLFCALVL